MELPIYQVDAFTNRAFGGNPAAVMPLERWLDDALMQQIAAENNLSETAFFVPEGDRWRLRWFTPTVEVDLCGHATLAAAWVLFHELGCEDEQVAFATRSGVLTVTRHGEQLEMDLPAIVAQPVDSSAAISAGLGTEPERLLEAPNGNYLAVFADVETVSALTPDFVSLKPLGRMGFIATAPGLDCDFVSRFFAPAAGIDEDPVTGSAHSTLAPYWQHVLGRDRLSARQISQRGGELDCLCQGDRVLIRGQAVTTLRGRFDVPLLD